MTSLMKLAATDFAVSRSSTTISADPPVEPWRAQASRSSSPGFAPPRSVPCFASSVPGRDWHHLLELCGVVDARVIDLDGAE
jgi:hypothetical protein